MSTFPFILIVQTRQSTHSHKAYWTMMRCRPARGRTCVCATSCAYSVWTSSQAWSIPMRSLPRLHSSWQHTGECKMWPSLNSEVTLILSWHTVYISRQARSDQRYCTLRCINCTCSGTRLLHAFVHDFCWSWLWPSIHSARCCNSQKMQLSEDTNHNSSLWYTIVKYKVSPSSTMHCSGFRVTLQAMNYIFGFGYNSISIGMERQSAKAKRLRDSTRKI